MMAECLRSVAVAGRFAGSSLEKRCDTHRRRSATRGRADMSKLKMLMRLRGKVGREWRGKFVIFAANDGVEVEQEVKGAILPSGEWPENFSILNFEDLSKHYEPSIFKAEAQPSTFLADVMSRTIYTASPKELLEEVDHHFAQISGLPVVDETLKCIGVLSKKDRSKASKGLKSAVGEVMSSPAITLSADRTVSDAAVLMLKNKIHRIPIVNESEQVVGIVTRTDIFTALEGGP
ncbi:hypothetical protein O6H91_09G090700 [Diphasiastrum complanatum]|uniref:Uncharacterized protein n=1 Tax=Diphasiastrum complanatum TaxID=34168 RepID=A0ACC2CRY8_DIPCM|nr:hypothetical protein O6H91_09G090700 [Diphasiastrum complanatum]